MSPLRNGTGPAGQGTRTGQGLGRGGGRGRQPGGFGLGPEGQCFCPNCGTKASHQRGVPCYEQKCPKCGQAMTRAR
jgi:hypothetical protein